MKTAIYLRGHCRTWNMVKKSTISLINTLYDNPDWYVSFWNTNTISKKSLQEDFINSNLKFININVDEKLFNSKFNLRMNCLDNDISFSESNYLKSAFLDNLISFEKRNYETENKFEYDNVIYIRPDILYRFIDEDIKSHYTSPIQSMEIQNIFDSKWWGDDEWMASDFFNRLGNAASNLFDVRFFDVNYTDGKDFYYTICPHSLLSRFHLKHSIITNNAPMVSGIIVRPNLPLLNAELLLNIEDEYKLNEILKDEHSHMYNEEWSQLRKKKDVKKLIYICMKNKIDPRDYQIDMMCKLVEVNYNDCIKEYNKNRLI